MRPPRHGAAPALAVRAALLCLASALGIAAAGPRTNADRPPPGHTGGFGEPTCQACHTDAAANSGPGALTISGVPRCAEPGAEYELTVELRHDRMRVAGFQVSARSADGAQAGTFAPAAGEETRVGTTTDAGVQYAHHLYDGTDLADAGAARWSVTWKAGDAGPATFHAAAVAGDSDLSPLGDDVFTATDEASCKDPESVRR